MRTLSRAALLALFLALPAVAHAASVDGSVTMVGDSGDYISGGLTELFDQPGTLQISGSSSLVQVNTPTPFGGVFGYTLSFASPSGSDLHVGAYDNAERWPFEPTGEAGLDVSGDGRGCNEDFGRFVVKDIHLTGGVPDRFWAVYEQHCESPHAPALLGEVRVGEPASALPETVEPLAVNWPNTDVGTDSTTVPVTVTAGPSGTTVASASLQGTNAGDFHIVSDTCSGTHLTAGGTCVVSVRATPTALGDRSAQLAITDNANNQTTVDLAMLTQPDVTKINPDTGSGAGGTTVTITGRDFTGVTGVSFGSNAASSYTVDSPTQITATTPPGTAPATVGVEVAGTHGHSWAYQPWDFHYATVPAAPSILSAQAGPERGTASVSFVPGLDGGARITSYTVTASPGGAHATGETWPITVSGLDDATTYTFTVSATNVIGTGPPSSPSNPVTTLRPTTTMASATPDASVFGTPLDLTAVVSTTFSGTPTGSVQFDIDGDPVGSAVPIASDGHTGQATQAYPDVGSTISATYSGDISFAKSHASVQPTVTPAHTSLSVTSSGNPVPASDEVDIGARVTNLDTDFTPFGSVQFLVDGSPVLDPVPLDDFGDAAIIASFPAGNYVIDAVYHDDTAAIPDFIDSNATLTQVVTEQAPVNTTRPPVIGTGPIPHGTTNGANDAFAAAKPTVSGGVIVFQVQSVDTGVLSFLARTVRKFAVASRRATVVYARGNVISRGFGHPRYLKIRPNARGRRLLAVRKRLKLRITLTFRSANGGTPSHVVVPVTVTRKRQPARHRR